MLQIYFDIFLKIIRAIFILTKKIKFDFILAKFWLDSELNRFCLIEFQILI